MNQETKQTIKDALSGIWGVWKSILGFTIALTALVVVAYILVSEAAAGNYRPLWIWNIVWLGAATGFGAWLGVENARQRRATDARIRALDEAREERMEALRRDWRKVGS